MFPHERYCLAPWNGWISLDMVGVDREAFLEDDLQRALKRVY